MHTTRLTEPDEKGRRWIVKHNSNWSGEAYLDRLQEHEDGSPATSTHGIMVPGAALLAVAEKILDQRQDDIMEAMAGALRGEK